MHKLLLTFFYSGTAPKAPGTFGSFASLIFWLVITKFFCDYHLSLLTQNIIWISFLIIATLYASYAIPIYTKQFGQMDHKSVVLDETVGQIITLQCGFIAISIITPYFSSISLTTTHLLSSFIFFRLFDITKPSIIGKADKMKSGFGVMLDDILAGFAAAFCSISTLFIIVIIGIKITY